LISLDRHVDLRPPRDDKSNFPTGSNYKNDFGFYKKIEDIFSLSSVASVLPGPYPSHRPKEVSSGPAQCEFGLQSQKITYEPQGEPILDIDDERLPTTLVGARHYCVRLWESDEKSTGWWGILTAAFANDTPIIQFTVDIAELQGKGTIYYSHNPQSQTNVVKGIQAINMPSIFKIGLTILDRLEQPKTWGTRGNPKK